MTDGINAKQKMNLERFVLLYAPLILAWWMGISSISKQFNNSFYGIVIATLIISIVAFMVRRIETSIYVNLGKIFALRYLFFSFIPLIVTFACNLNVIYPYLMMPTLLREEAESKRASLVELQATVAASQKNFTAASEWEKQIDTMIAQVEQQITSPKNVGAGKLTEALLLELEKTELLGQKITRHVGKINNLEDAKEVAAVYKEQLNRMKNNHKLHLIKTTGEENFASISKGLASSIADLDVAIKALTDKTGGADVRAIAAIKKATDSYNEITTKQREYLDNKAVGTVKKLESQNEGFGKLEHTIESVGKNLSRAGTWAALIAALLVDLWAIVLAFFYTTPAAPALQQAHGRAPVVSEDGAISMNAPRVGTPNVRLFRLDHEKIKELK